MKDMKRALRRHHAARIKRHCEEYIRNCWNNRPELYMTQYEWRYRDGKPVGRIVYLIVDWRERYEKWVRTTVRDEASHRPHFCQMCKKPRYDRRRDRPWY